MSIEVSGIKLVVEGEGAFLGAMRKADEVVLKFGKSSDKAGKKVETAFDKASKHIDSFGRNARIGLGSAAQIADQFGLSIGNSIAPVMQLADGVGDLTSAVHDLSEGTDASLRKFETLSVVGVGAFVVAFGVLNAAMEKRNQELAESILKNDAYVVSAKKVIQADSEAAQAARDYAEARARATTGWSFEVGDVVDRYLQMDTVGRGIAQGLNMFGVDLSELNPIFDTSAEKAEQYKAKLQELEDQFYKDQYAAASFAATMANLKPLDPKLDVEETNEYTLALARADGIVKQFEDGTITLQEALTRLNSVFGLSHAQVDLYTGKLIALDGQAQLTANSLAILAGNVNAAAYLAQGTYENYADAFMRTSGAGKAMNEVLQRGTKYMDEQNEAAKRLAEQGLREAEAQAQHVIAKFRGLVEQQLTFTPVTQADMDLSAQGNYVDKWDETLRRLKTGDIDQFGADFANQIRGLGMPLDEVIQKFENFQLFLGGQNFDLVNFDALTSDIENNLLSVAGKGELVEEAMKRVWANLSPTAKAALAEQGLGSAEDALKEFLDPAGKAKDEVADLNKEINATPKLVSTLFETKTEDAKKVVEEFAAFLDEFINAYGAITVEASGEFARPPTGGIPPGGTIPGRAEGGYVSKGLYWLGEQGREYVLPAPLVKWVESLLGGPIRDPRQIEWLVGALDTSKDEALFALQNWAGGMTDWGYTLPDGATNWIDRIYKRYRQDHPDDIQSAAMRGGASGAVGSTAGGGVGDDLGGVIARLDQIVNNTYKIYAVLGQGMIYLAAAPTIGGAGDMNIVNVNVNSPTVQSTAQIDRLANQIAESINRKVLTQRRVRNA